MQDAVELKHFFESKRPLLMIVDSTRAESKRLLAAAGTLADPNHIVFRIKAKPTLPLTTLFELFSHHWAVRYSDVEASHSQDQLNFIVECLTAHNQNCVLLVAQAHLLSDVFLRALCRLAEVQENKMPRIRLILSGYPELVEKVNAWYSSATEKPPVVFASDVISAENKKTFLALVFLYIKNDIKQRLQEQP